MAEHHVGHPSAEDEYLATPPGAGHEHTDANTWLIAKFAFWLAVTALAVHGLMGIAFVVAVDRRAETGEAQFPLAVGQERRLPAQPRLQAQPLNEIYEFRLQERSVLDNYGWVDREAGVVRLPIAEAMRLTVERGLPVREAAPASAAETADLVPADSSAGRTMVRRRQ